MMSRGRSRHDLIRCFGFLHRPLLPSRVGGVRDGGLVVYETFVHPQREMFRKPRKDAHLVINHAPQSRGL